MPAYYTYLISSLPALEFKTAPPFSFEDFLEICQPHIPQQDFSLLKDCASAKKYPCAFLQPTLRKWQEFDTTLRNELVKIRCSRKKIAPDRFLRRDGLTAPLTARAALNASRNPSLIEAERALDLERWRVLEGLSFGHYFDLDYLLIYAQKLLLLQRWQKINSTDKVQQLENLLQ